MNEALERMAVNPALTVLARAAMFVTPILVSIGLFVLGNWLNTNAKAMEAMSERITASEAVSNNLNNRLTVIEARSAIIGPQRDKFQAETTEALKAVNERLGTVLQQQARILAIIEPGRP